MAWCAGWGGVSRETWDWEGMERECKWLLGWREGEKRTKRVPPTAVKELGETREGGRTLGPGAPHSPPPQSGPRTQSWASATKARWRPALPAARIGFPCGPGLGSSRRRGLHGPGGRGGTFPPTKFQRNFDLCIVYITILKGT